MIAACALDIERLGESGSFDKSPVLGLDGKETRALHFFPEVEAGGVPVLAYIGEIIGNDGPDDFFGFLGLAVLHQPVAVGDECLWVLASIVLCWRLRCLRLLATQVRPAEDVPKHH